MELSRNQKGACLLLFSIPNVFCFFLINNHFFIQFHLHQKMEKAYCRMAMTTNETTFHLHTFSNININISVLKCVTVIHKLKF